MLTDLLSDFRATRQNAGEDVDRATCWATRARAALTVTPPT